MAIERKLNAMRYGDLLRHLMALDDGIEMTKGFFGLNTNEFEFLVAAIANKNHCPEFCRSDLQEFCLRKKFKNYLKSAGRYIDAFRALEEKGFIIYTANKRNRAGSLSAIPHYRLNEEKAYYFLSFLRSLTAKIAYKFGCDNPQIKGNISDAAAKDVMLFLKRKTKN